MSYVDPSTQGTPTAGAPVATAWGTAVQTDIELFNTEISSLQSSVSSLQSSVSALQSDEADSGWTTLPLAAGYTASSGAAYRKIGHFVYLRGAIASGTSGGQFMTMPAGFLPTAANQNIALAATGAGATAAEITMVCAGASGAGNTFVYGAFPVSLDGLSYPIDQPIAATQGAPALTLRHVTISATPRLGLTQWSADTDSPSRSQFETSFSNIDTNAAMFVQGTVAAMPAYGIAGRFYWATDIAVMFYDTGTSWVVPNAEPWQSYSPVWASSGTAPAIGNGELTGRYQVIGQKTFNVRLEFRPGTTTTWGSGDYTFSTPPGFVAPDPPLNQILSAYINSGGYNLGGIGLVEDAELIQPLFSQYNIQLASYDTLLVQMGPTVPYGQNPVSGAVMNIQGVLESA